MTAEAVETPVEVAPPRPGTKAYLQAQVRSMREEVAAARDSERDLAYLVEAVRRECVKRGWCSEYEVFVRFHNKRMSRPRLLERQSVAPTTTAPGTVPGCNCQSCRRANGELV